MIGLVCVTRFASAAIWSGGGESNVWSVAANWDVLPANGEALTFGGTQKTTNTNDLLSSVGAVSFSTAGWVICGNAVTLAGDMTHTAANGTVEWGLDTVLSGTRKLSVGGSKTIILSGLLSGTGGMNSSAGWGFMGTIRIAGASNTFSGTVSSDSATLEVTRLANGGQPSSLGQGASDITVGSAVTGAAGSFKYIGSGDTSTDRKLKMLVWGGVPGGIYNNSPDNGSLCFTAKGAWYMGWRSAAQTLRLYGTSKGTNAIDGILGNGTYGGSPSYETSLAVNTSGAWVLNGTNTYSGTTSVEKGMLFINGMLSGMGAVSVAAGGLLSGTGAITGAVSISTGGSLVAGANGVGTLNLCSNLTFVAGATNAVSIAGRAAGQFSSLRVTGGDVTLANATLVIDASQYRYSGIGVIPVMELVTSGKTVSGTFDNLPEGARIKSGELLCTISYSGGDGNDVVLRIIPRGTCISIY
jgi:autotransporter-associated beta strand protein